MKGGKKPQIPTAPGEAEIEEKRREKRGKLGLKWCFVRCWLLEREREGKKEVENWEFPHGFGNSQQFLGISHGFGSSQGFGMRRIPKKEREKEFLEE